MKLYIDETTVFEVLYKRLEAIEKQLEILNSENNQSQKEYLKTREVAELLQFTPRHIQNLRDKGILPFSQIGRTIRYRFQDIQDFMMDYYVNPKNLED